MDKEKKSLSEIAHFVRNKADSVQTGTDYWRQIGEVKKILDKLDADKNGEFIITAGDQNAYLG